MQIEQVKEVKEMKEADDKTVPVQLSTGDFSGHFPPSFSQPRSLTFLRRTVVFFRRAGPLAIFGAALTFAPIGFPQADKPSETAKTQEKTAPLSHDLSGVWM